MPESKRFLLRLDPRLFEALRRWAQDDLRSINAQMEYLLTEQVRRAGRLPHKPAPPPAGDDDPGDGSDEDESIDADERVAPRGR